MAELVVTQDELAMRRRARRRLVGAVAIALTVVVALPMLFDSKPKPLGPEVDIRIPAHDAPFDPAPAPAPAAVLPAPQPAEPTQSPGLAVTSAEPTSRVVPATDNKKTVSGSPAAAEKPKLATKSEPKPEPKAEPRPPLKPDSNFSSQGYFLQLGAFGSEQNARQLQSKASAAGFNVVMIGANGQYRVRVGPIPQHAKALEMQAKLKAKGFSPVLLGP